MVVGCGGGWAVFFFIFVWGLGGPGGGVDCHQWSFPGSERKAVGRTAAKVLTGTCPLGAMAGRKARGVWERFSADVKQSKSTLHLLRSAFSSITGVIKRTCMQLICALSTLSSRGRLA